MAKGKFGDHGNAQRLENLPKCRFQIGLGISIIVTIHHLAQSHASQALELACCSELLELAINAIRGL